MYTTTVKSDLFLETLLVLDKEFLNHHKDADVEHYVMTLMNVVSLQNTSFQITYK